MRTLYALAAASISVCVVLHGQQQPAGPTMDETAAWLASDGKDLMRAVRLQEDKIHPSIYQSEERVDTFALNDCTLMWRTIEESRTTTFTKAGRPNPGDLTTHTTDVTLSLHDVTAGGVNLESDPMLTDKPVAVVRLAPRSSSEATSFTSRDFGNPTGIRFASIPAQSAEDGQRIVNAIKWAVGLCNVGAKKGPF